MKYISSSLSVFSDFFYLFFMIFISMKHVYLTPNIIDICNFMFRRIVFVQYKIDQLLRLSASEMFKQALTFLPLSFVLYYL